MFFRLDDHFIADLFQRDICIYDFKFSSTKCSPTVIVFKEVFLKLETNPGLEDGLVVHKERSLYALS